MKKSIEFDCSGSPGKKGARATRMIKGELLLSLMGQLSQIGRQLSDYPFDPEALRRHLDQAIKGQFSPEGKNVSVQSAQLEEVVDWRNFYQRALGRKLVFSGISIPKKPAGKWRLLIVPSVSLEEFRSKKKKKPVFKFCTKQSLDEIIVQNERTAQLGAYALWVKPEMSADDDLRNISADEIRASRVVATMTSLEAIVYTLKVLDETEEGKKNCLRLSILCSGSRYIDGTVPRVDCFGQVVTVGWQPAKSSFGGQRARKVVFK